MLRADADLNPVATVLRFALVMRASATGSVKSPDPSAAPKRTLCDRRPMQHLRRTSRTVR